MQGGMMEWYWQVIMAVVILDVAFVLAALLRSIIPERRRRNALEERQEQALPQESILRFLAGLSLVEGEKTRF
jgi:hypothetical protein